MTEKVFERLLEEAVCKMAQEEEQSYPSRSELQERYRLSDRFYQRMEQLILKVEQGEMRKGRRTKAAICAACLLLFILSTIAASVVDLPFPVGPVTRTSPCSLSHKPFTDAGIPSSSREGTLLSTR